MNGMNLHSSHAAIKKRLKRAEGHLHSIVEMMDANRPCLELAQQLHAVEKAISAAKKALVHDHIDHCLEDAIGALPSSASTSLHEFKEITKYL